MPPNDNKENIYVFTCLHCNGPFVIHHADFNCKILRHGVYKHNLQPINPHASKEECDALVASERIYGCAGPLLITKIAAGSDGTADSADGVSDAYCVTICGYI